MITAAETVTRFLTSLRRLAATRPQEAVEQIEGALKYDGIGDSLAPEDRQRLVRARLAILAGKAPES